MHDTKDDEDRSLAQIEMCRRLNRKAGEQYRLKGVSADDVVIAAIFSAHDLALQAGHTAHGAIELLRTALDVQETDLMKRMSAHVSH